MTVMQVACRLYGVGFRCRFEPLLFTPLPTELGRLGMSGVAVVLADLPFPPEYVTLLIAAELILEARNLRLQLGDSPVLIFKCRLLPVKGSEQA